FSNFAPPVPNCENQYAGWALYVIYEDPNESLKQINLYDGYKMVGGPDALNSLSIDLDNLNVLSTQDARAGFLAWEGEKELAVNENLYINGTIISDPPLNPPDNAFNGTISYTDNDSAYEMDFDDYDISSAVNV